MTKRMLIDAAHADETRVVLLDHDQVYDYDFVTSSKAQNKGNIYLAKITRVEPSLQAAFVEYGGGKQGFLPFAEIHPDYYQLTAEDKAKLVAEQIAEAEAEEAAEEEAFEREQAARESRRRSRGAHGDSDADSEGEDDDFVPEEDAARDETRPEPETIVAMSEFTAADTSIAGSITDLPPVEVPAHRFDAEPPVTPYAVEPLNAPGFAIHSDPLPEENPAIDANNTEATSAEDASAMSETTAEDGEETGSRNSRPGRSTAFHRRYRIQEVIKRNQIVLVQVIKEERGNKGCSLTTFISLAGRAAVLMPNSPKGGGISRKITDRETRRRLKEVAAEMRTHRGMSVIIRTAGIDRTKAEIRRDYEYLVKLWNQIREETLASTAPALIYEEGNLIKRSLRDLYTSDVEEVIIEGEASFNEAKEFMRMLMPSHAARVKLYKESMPIFAYAGVEDQLAAMTEPQVRLPSGGYLVIHPTEALISIDVNSGRSTTERNVEETAIKTNMEAAAEVARQLRLRDLAGLIVIDFIDMGYGKNRKAVERVMKDSLKADRAKIQIGRISTFGLMELSRQRLRPSISEAMGVMCPHCRGTGYIHSVETVGIQIIRALEKEAASGDYVALRVTTHPEAALYLLNEKRTALQAIEQRYGITVAVLMDASMITGNHRLIKLTADGKEILHEPVKPQQQRGSSARGGARRGRRGGRDGQSSGGVNFDNAVAPADAADDAYEPLPDDDEIIGGSAMDEDNAEFAAREPRGERPRRDRGGRGRNNRDRGRNRERGPREDRPDRTPRDPAQIAEAANTNPGEPAPVALDENGQPIERADRNRRRGRRGGRNRSRADRPRREDGTIGNPITSGSTPTSWGDSTSGEETVARHSSHHTPVPSASDSASGSRPSLVIPLSEKQTNPAAIASPIISQSSANEGTPKKKGWWSRVLES